MRFLAAPSDVNWGGKVHGGTVMRWIDDAAYVCAVTWSRRNCVAVYAGGVRFYQPLLIGHFVEVQARPLYISAWICTLPVNVRSADPKAGKWSLTTHSLMILIAVDDQGEVLGSPPWRPAADEDTRLERHTIRLMELRSRVR